MDIFKKTKYKQFFNFLIQHLVYYPTPSNINYFWGFGSLAGLCLVIQLLSGIFLAMHYSTHVDLAFNSVEHIMRDVNYGWLIRYLHSNGASMFFIIVYIHIGRGLYFGSFMGPRGLLWVSGVIIFFLMMATAFMGYVLPWGQMSFWGATVITNLFSAIPVIGQDIAYWLWGGYSVDNATLNRFFSLHYLLPFLIAGVTIAHLGLLHLKGSSTPIGIRNTPDKVQFYPYFLYKDLVGLICFLLFYFVLLFYYPNLLGHSDNYIEANPLVTPSHIVPEWYFLPFYAILRSIPNKLGGVVCMGAAIFVLALLPLLKKYKTRTNKFKSFFNIFYWLLVVNVFILGWLGAQPVEQPYILIGQIATIFYFLYFLLIIPCIDFIDYYLIKRYKKIVNK